MKAKFVALFCFAIFSCSAVSVTFAQETATQEKKTSQEENKQETKTAEKAAPKDNKQAPAAPFKVTVGEGNNIVFTAPGGWEKVVPKVNFIEAELKIPRVGTDTKDGRLTIMGAGGTIEANILRWQGQFKQADGSATKDHTKVEKKMVSGQQVSFVDITGTYIDSPGGPFAGGAKIERPSYRMMAAIIQTAQNGNYFVKLYGPKATIDKNAEALKTMVKSIQTAD